MQDQTITPDTLASKRSQTGAKAQSITIMTETHHAHTSRRPTHRLREDQQTTGQKLVSTNFVYRMDAKTMLTSSPCNNRTASRARPEKAAREGHLRSRSSSKLLWSTDRVSAQPPRRSRPRCGTYQGNHRKSVQYVIGSIHIRWPGPKRAGAPSKGGDRLFD